MKLKELLELTKNVDGEADLIFYGMDRYRCDILSIKVMTSAEFGDPNIESDNILLLCE